VLVDGDGAVGGFELDGGAAGAEVGVNGFAMAFGLIDARGRDSAVDGGGDEVGGVGMRGGDGDATVGGLGVEAASLPGRAGEVGVDAAVGGVGVHFAGEIIETEAAVGGFGADVAVESGERDATVAGVEVGGEVARDEQAVVDRPVAVAGSVGTFGLDGGAGFDGDFVEEGLGVGPAAGACGYMGFEGDVLTIFADDVDAAVLAVDVKMSVDEGNGGGADFADLLGTAEPVKDAAIVIVAVVARVGGEGLGVERGGSEQGGVRDKGETAHGGLLRFRHREGDTPGTGRRFHGPARTARFWGAGSLCGW
jgi:hypothetical protein